MGYVAQVIFFFGGIGLFNAIISAIYLLTSKLYSKLQNKLFGLFLLVLSLRVLKSLFYAFSPEGPLLFLKSDPWFFLWIGPLFFFYVASVVAPDSFWVKFWKAHFLLWILTVVCLSIFIPFKENVVLTKTLLLPIINLQWLFFIVFSALIVHKNKNSGLSAVQINWLTILILNVTLIWASFSFVSFDYFVTGSIIFSILFYSCFLFFLFNKNVAAKIFVESKQENSYVLTEENKSLLDKIDAVMVKEKLFVNPNLKLTEVAKRINISPHELSKLINRSLGKNFADFINEYRVEESKKLLNINSIYTVEAIGNQSGFKSKSTFYAAFKKCIGTTPARYKEEVLGSKL